MFETLIALSLLLPAQTKGTQEIPVQSAVVSLIDDVELSFREAGFAASIRVRPGDLVRRGDLLVELDTQETQLELQRVEADLEMVKLKAGNDLSVQLGEKALQVAKTELSRAVKANERFPDTVSSSEIDRLQLRVDEAKLQVEQAKMDVKTQQLHVRLKEAERAIVQNKIQRRQLRSPIDGVVVRCDLQGGELTHPEQMICRLINMDRLRVEGFVQASSTVKTGDKVIVRWEKAKTAEQEEISGVITFVDPEIDTITNQYKVWAEIKNMNKKLRPGHRPEMIILSNAETISPVSKNSQGDRKLSVQ